MQNAKNIYVAVIYFCLSSIVTWWFIDICPLYSGVQQKLLSCGIAGAKWSLQLLIAYLYLPEKQKWVFIKNIGFTCLIGSIILLPYSVLATYSNLNGNIFFVGSLMAAVLIMIILYFINVKKLNLSLKWFGGWIFCLAIAIFLQLTVVFSVIKF